jgi:hypothetical protein
MITAIPVPFALAAPAPALIAVPLVTAPSVIVLTMSVLAAGTVCGHFG